MNIVLLIHGLKDSKATGLLRLREYLQNGGFFVRVAYYGWFLLRGVLWWPFNVPVARVLAAFVGVLHDLGHKVICVAHSNGAAIAAKASEFGAPFDVMVFINGALERDAKIGDRVGILLNCRVPSDPVLAASWVIAPFSPWAGLDGSFGNFGIHSGKDQRMWDIDLTKEFGITGHGGFFDEQNVSQTGPWLVRSLNWALGATKNDTA